METKMETNSKGTVCYKGRFGYYGYSYETFLKLKKLKKELWRTAHQLGAWIRWYRKQPQNRVIRKKIKNEAGQTIGYHPAIPMTEPTYNETLVIGKESLLKHLSWNWKIHIPDYINTSILEAFDQARKPCETPESVQAPILSEAQITALYEASVKN